MSESGRHFLGILFIYVWLLVSVYFGSSGFGVFVSFALELIILLVLYGVSRIIDGFRNPKKYENHPLAIQSIFVGGTMIFVQFMFGRHILSETDLGDNTPTIPELFSEWPLWIAGVLILFFYLLGVIKKPLSKIVDDMRDRFLMNFVLLTILNLGGMFAVISFENKVFVYVLMIMVIVRFIFELLLFKPFQMHRREV